jgi:putative SOS response-associated peptidase YedK
MIMCGRFTQTAKERVLADLFELMDTPELPALEARYNIAPSQPVAAARVSPEHGRRELVALRWGLVPAWAEDLKIGYRLINARAETAATKPSFRLAFRSRRCLIPADGYFEWQQQDGKKQPFYFHKRDGQPFAFAGLWERWAPPDAEAVESCTILTTAANDLARPVHDRMPVIVAPTDFSQWLDPNAQPKTLQALLRPYPAEEMDAYAVTTFVNNPKNQGPRCVEALA